MRLLRQCALALLVLCSALACKGSSAAGTYHIQQDNNALGEGAEKGALALHDDATFEITIGQLALAKGTWKAENGLVSLSQGSGNMGTTYRIDGNKLIPVVNGKDLTSWRFIR